MPDSFDIERIEEFARLDTFIHRLDARSKVLTTFTFIIVLMSFPRHDLSAVTAFVAYPAAIIALSHIPTKFLLRKVLIAAPFALMVAIVNPLIDREPLALVGEYAVSGGWLSFFSIMLRFSLIILAVIVLIASTGMYRLCAGLEQLGLPRALAVQLLLLHRYVFVIGGEAARMSRGARTRSFKRHPLTLRQYGSLLGHLLLRTMDRAERIYQAMLARGFDGEIRVMRKPRLSARDFGFCCCWLAYFTACRTWNLAVGIESLLRWPFL